MDVDLPGEPVEVVLEAATRLVLCIEIEKREQDFIGEKPALPSLPEVLRRGIWSIATGNGLPAK